MIRSLMNGDILSVLTAVIAVILSMSIHEMAHGLASLYFGDPTAKMRGRLTLNPLKHIDWYGLVCLLLFGFGWAKPVPIDPRYYKDPKTGMIWTAFAGPLANFLLAFVCVFLYTLLSAAAPAFMMVNGFGSFLGSVLAATASMSTGFGIFNLIPIPPLDGSRIFWAFLPDRDYYRMNEPKPWMNILFLILIFSGILNQPLAMLRSWIITAFLNASTSVVSLFL